MSESSAEVQREVEAERAGLVNTLDQLRENLKPGNVIDEVMASAKVTTSDVTDKVWHTARGNPVAAVLIGIGAAMILGVGNHVMTRSTPRVVDRPSADDWDDEDWGTSGGEAYAPVGQNNSRIANVPAARTLTSLGSTSASQIASSAASLRDQASRTAFTYASSARDGLDSIPGDTVMNQYSRSRDQISGTLSRLLDEQPLVLAALGVAVGAAIGAAIPSTEAEGRLMGDASVSLKSRAQELAQQEYAHLKETASATLGDLKQTAADHGVSTDNVSGLIQDVGSKVRDAASDVATHATDKGGSKA